MALSYACFISYRHSDNATVKKIVSDFHALLEAQLALHSNAAKVFLDRDGMKAGDLVDPAIARDLCGSGCMVILYSPDYFHVDECYCAREYQAMVGLESRRHQILPDELRTKGLIFPVVIRGGDYLPAELSKRQPKSLEKGLTAASDLRKRPQMDLIREVADEIYPVFRTLQQIGEAVTSPCPGFALPSKSAIEPWLKQVTSALHPLPVPGRLAGARGGTHG